eukprot:CAMPEP_0179065046 /NCGR_PEP_ID=MMETSP0796-20121207/28256_1 /TAXON_ID=73915 /ORGANISM="Pyrodinium bahamense, Strain pbaha01" /LENGTH=165 /DNA_ID=CAMNT_0020762001 /DNA_START=116 /DNA_END=614 /DNA_ORIENTATION=-
MAPTPSMCLLSGALACTVAGSFREEQRRQGPALASGSSCEGFGLFQTKVAVHSASMERGGLRAELAKAAFGGLNALLFLTMTSGWGHWRQRGGGGEPRPVSKNDSCQGQKETLVACDAAHSEASLDGENASADRYGALICHHGFPLVNTDRELFAAEAALTSGVF